jgi:hypothetical protein
MLREDEIGVACDTHEGRRNVYKILVGKSEGNRQLGGFGRMWDDNIKVGLKEMVCEGVDWIHVAQ